MILNVFAAAIGLFSFNNLEVNQGINVNCIKEDNNISYTIENVKSNFEKDYYKIKDLISMYNLDEDCLKKAENVSFSVDKIEDSGGYIKYGSNSYSDDEGYITMTTIVYDYGICVSGQKIYYTQVNLKYDKCFKLRNTDSLIIRTGDGAVIDFDCDNSASFKYQRTLGNGTIYNQNVTKDYSSSYGINYKVQLPNDIPLMGSSVSNQAINWEMTASYYFIAKSTTYVQACYVHNESLAGDKLSISIKGVGLSISGSNTTY